MKVACIGDVHGTTKFIDAYMDIVENHKDIEKIIVFGDWFDPYKDIDVDLMIERYNEAWDIMSKDDRCVCLIGNHDISGYIIHDGGTNRTFRNPGKFNKIRDAVLSHIDECYLVYNIGNYLFSHAGVSQTWFDEVFTPNKQRLFNDLDLFQKGWEPSVLDNIAGFSTRDYTGYGDNEYQGPTWIRPTTLINCMYGNYDQVVAHTRLEKIVNVKDAFTELDKNLWIIDNSQGSEYLILDVDTGESDATLW